MDTTYQSNNNVIPQARYLATPETLLDGQFAPASCDSSGNTKQSLGTTIAGEDIPNDVTKVEFRNNATYISTATTTPGPIVPTNNKYYALIADLKLIVGAKMNSLKNN